MRLIFSILSLVISGTLFSQCTLEIQSLVATPVSCNGQSNGTVTVNAIGGNGAISFSAGGAGAVISPNQPFNTSASLSTASGSGPLTQWWSPSSCTGGPYIYSSTLGCPAGSAVYNGGSSSFGGCFLRSPQLNMNGIDLVNVTFDLSNSYSASRLNDRIRIYCWVNNSYMSVPANYSINGVSGQYLNFTEARNCQQISVDINLAGIPTNSRADFLFYIETSCGYSNCSPYQAVVDNIVISQAAPSQASNVFTGLPEGNFQVTATDASGCTVTQTVYVSQPEPLTLTTTSTPTTTIGGNNGTATVTISGGNSNPQITWNTNPVQTTATAIGLTPGNYIVNVMDSQGCSTNTSISVGEPSCENFIISSILNNQPSCFNGNDGSIEVIATSPNGNTSYSLNNQAPQTSGNFNNLIAGNYSVTITDAAGCSINSPSPIIITQPAELNPVIILLDNALTTSGFTSYQWYLNGELIAGETDSQLYFSANGAYYVSVTDVNGCIGISNTIDVFTTSIQNTFNDLVKVFPNPFADYILIQNNTLNSFESYRIYSVTGQLIASGSMNKNDIKINTTHLNSGIYNLNLVNNSNSFNFKLIKY